MLLKFLSQIDLSGISCREARQIYHEVRVSSGRCTRPDIMATFDSSTLLGRKKQNCSL